MKLGTKIGLGRRGGVLQPIGARRFAGEKLTEKPLRLVSAAKLYVDRSSPLPYAAWDGFISFESTVRVECEPGATQGLRGPLRGHRPRARLGRAPAG